MKKLLIFLLVLINLNAFSQISSVVNQNKKTEYKIISGKLIYFPAAVVVGTPVKVAAIPNNAENVVKDLGVLTLRNISNEHIKIKPGIYSGIDVVSPKNAKIDASGVIIQGGSLDVFEAEGLEISGLSIINYSYRALNIRGFSNNIYFHDMVFKNIGNYVISYEYNGIYDGTDETASMNWKFEHLTFENTSGPGFAAGGGYDEKGIRNLMKNFKFLNNTIKNCPGIGNIIWSAAFDNYEIAGNTIENINSSFPANAPNGIHNGIFMITGNGSFHDNKIKNHQGNAIRAWGMSYGPAIKSIRIYNNVVWNSWKYSAFELQATPDMNAYFKNYPQRAKYTNAQVYNNTAGHLNTSKDWEGQMIDVYGTGGGTLEYYNNLGFDMNRSQGPITNMINFNGDTKLIKNYGNKYFQSSKLAISDTKTFRSLHKGIGAP